MEYVNTSTSAESKKLIELYKVMDGYIEKGDFYEHYSCWVDEEKKKREGEVTLQL
ncbi:hypothetical protein [Sporosarcina sp. JAI121]|uniref:hypothetical protein n=1 Tax=Sporosarcina sp. JAI121 TaxID=2723064 RepID=UPI0017C819A1|nr:hypothetical protein [Sporosarcina sp. JAI121]NYF25393.1 hypothetical protein [Sporosarcina sp. JAI121]